MCGEFRNAAVHTAALAESRSDVVNGGTSPKQNSTLKVLPCVAERRRARRHQPKVEEREVSVACCLRCVEHAASRNNILCNGGKLLELFDTYCTGYALLGLRRAHELVRWLEFFLGVLFNTVT